MLESECGIQDESNGKDGIVKAKTDVGKPDNASAQPVSNGSEWLSKM